MKEKEAWGEAGSRTYGHEGDGGTQPYAQAFLGSYKTIRFPPVIPRVSLFLSAFNAT